MSHMLIFGMGYAAGHLAHRLRARGWQVTGTTRDGRDGTIAFAHGTAVLAALRSATHILSSVPPVDDDDPVLARYGDAIALAPATWTGYLSSTGVYGDTGGAWVDESAPVKGRRAGRNAADAAWVALRGDSHVFRLPGIYGPGRSILDRIRQGRAHRIDLPHQVFSRIHVDDIASGIIASFRGPAGVYNLADDEPCHQNRLVEWGCTLLGAPLPPLQTLEEAGLSPAARAFYAENRRVANGKAKRLLGWAPRYPTFREGLAACP
ncbi:SDR family NAD(P)-dependent oxidoreductase [Sphingopyxis sp. LK2115]|jgi:nucleoside-diphosphate-sugar epimerase|uniref:SDR family NAD(P)-dependent oxidoreductase n=1 Tax=Sphingopyxis sp. LK2115 TaxID=2744558 RepID=UPI001660C957|nr:SDR family NAD(P)-dependent oxidoreductase [Sphingopyxis sp. LK2115]